MSALTFPPLRHEWSDHQRPVYLSFYPVCVCVCPLCSARSVCVRALSQPYQSETGTISSSGWFPTT